ncbi:MAG: TetR/AcrR family transcriptional regulator C-terminal domain-containing protein [Propionicimonas sp.]
MPSTTERGRERLDHTKVVKAAIGFADAEGLDALSMRALAARLGVVPMALYKHVADKEDLIGAMIDAIVTGYPTPSEPDWRGRVRSRVLAARSAWVVHPWLGGAIAASTRRTETVLAHMNAVAGDFIDGGVSADLTHYAMHALGTRIWGFSTEAFDDPDAPSPQDADHPEIAAYLAARFPHVVAIAMDAARRNPEASCDRQAEFEFTLELLLDSFERLHEAGWVSRPDSAVSQQT